MVIAIWGGLPHCAFGNINAVDKDHGKSNAGIRPGNRQCCMGKGTCARRPMGQAEIARQAESACDDDAPATSNAVKRRSENAALGNMATSLDYGIGAACV